VSLQLKPRLCAAKDPDREHRARRSFGEGQFRAEIRYRDDGQGRLSCRMRGSYAANGNPETAFEVSDCAANATLPRVIH